TSLFGMNTVNTPILGRPNDFWDIVIIMFGAVALMFIFFRYKKWL
ncbi:MAG: magnesium transporter, partial [Candidatus Vogelbacteria bacterium CG10_big_fil_rev_8_21_14_0_10_50_13]